MTWCASLEKATRVAVYAAGLLGAVSATALAQSAAPASEAPKDVRIGVLTDKSSIFSDLVGDGSVQAAQMAIDDFIAAEKPEFKISLVSADHSSKADVASSIARRWFDQDGVDLIGDVAGASVALAVSKLAPQYNKVVLVSAAAQNSLTNEECLPTVLHWTFNSYGVARTTAREMMKQGKDTWYFMTADYAGGHSLEQDAATVVKGAGGKILGVTRHPFNTADFSSPLLVAQSSGAKVIGLASAGNDLVTSIKQANEYGISKQQTLVGLNVFLLDVHALGLDMAQGMYLTSAFYWDLDEETRAWARRFFEKRQRMPTMPQAGLYSGVLHYLKAIKAGGTKEAKAVVAKMREIPVQDMFARNGKLREDGLMEHDLYLFQVKSPAESKYPWDYYSLKQVVPGAEAFQPLSQSTCPHVKKP